MDFRNRIALVLVCGTLVGCMSTTVGEVAKSDNNTHSDPVEMQQKRIDLVVENIQFDRGATLLRNLQWLINQKSLAVPSIITRLPHVNGRTRTNLVYVLGFSRTREARAALVASLKDADPIVRFEAAAGLLTQGDLGVVPILVGFLESDQKMVRYKAIEALRLGTGRDFEYRFSATVEARTASVGRWRSWWQQEQHRLMAPSITTKTNGSRD